MNREYATIEPKSMLNPLTGKMVFYGWEWVGDPAALVEIDWRGWHQVDTMPWNLEVLERRISHGTVIAYRTDVPMPTYAYYRFESDARAIAEWIKDVNRKLILTATVWGLGNIEPGDFISWGNIFKRRIKKGVDLSFRVDGEMSEEQKAELVDILAKRLLPTLRK